MAKQSPYNPTDRMDNCVACVAACLLHRVRGTLIDAEMLDNSFNITNAIRGSARSLDAMNKSIGLIAQATGLAVVKNSAGRPFYDSRGSLPAGHFAVFILGRGPDVLANEPDTIMYHVIYGRMDSASSNGMFHHLYDPQIDKEESMGRLVPPSYAVQFA